jgi:hypothetical protein
MLICRNTQLEGFRNWGLSTKKSEDSHVHIFSRGIGDLRSSVPDSPKPIKILLHD